MSASTCGRCGQALLPELVRELGDGTRCPFCAAPLPGARTTAASSGPPLVPPPPPVKAAAARAPTATLIGHAAPAATKPALKPVSTTAAGPSETHDWFRAPATHTPPTTAAPSAVRRTATFAAVPPVTPAPALAPVVVSAPSRVLSRVSASMPAVGPAGPLVAAARVSASMAAQPRVSGPVPIVAAAPVYVTATFETELVLGPERRRRRLVLAGFGGAIVLAASIGLATRAGRHAPAAPPVVSATTTSPSATVIPPPPAATPPSPSARPSRPPNEAAAPAPRRAPDEPAAAATTPTKSRAQVARTVADRPHEHVRRGADADGGGSRHATRERHKHVVAMKRAGVRPVAADGPAAHAAYQRGNGLLLGGNATGATTAYEEAVHLAPAEPEGYRGLGLAYEKEGKVDEAARAFRRYLKLAPRSRDRELVARRLKRLAHPDADDAP